MGIQRLHSPWSSLHTVCYSNYSVATMQGILAILFIAHTVTAQTTNTKAASYRVNCGCQCSDLTFRDKYNRVQGNCKTADNTGAQWCYTEYGSTCEDQQRSTSFGRQGKTWSYQACSTPSIYSAQCAGYNGGTVGGGIGGGICRNGNCGGNTGGFNGGFNGNNGGFNGGFNGNNGGFNGGFNGFNGGFGSGSIANCRHGQNCNVGNNAGLPTGQYNNGGFNPYNTGSSGLSGILQGRKNSKDKDSVKFGRK